MNPLQSNEGKPLHFAATVGHFKIWIDKTFYLLLSVFGKKNAGAGAVQILDCSAVVHWCRFQPELSLTKAVTFFSTSLNLITFSNSLAFFAKFSVADEDRRNATELYNPYTFSELAQKWPVSTTIFVISFHRSRIEGRSKYLKERSSGKVHIFWESHKI